MSEKIDVILLDKSNNAIQEINILRPNSYEEFIFKINSSFKNLPQYYNIFNIGENNKEFIINNNEKYKLMNDIIFIREINNNNLEQINVILVDNSNNAIQEINIVKPKTYYDFVSQIKSNFKNLPQYYEIFNCGIGNKEIIINNNETYKSMKGIIFVREINKNILKQSLFEINYNRLSESKQSILDDKYNCFICDVIIKNENPLFCYKCQKIFHYECLKQWDNKRKSQNQPLSCPNCRNELPLEKWNKKLDYEENRKNEAKIMEKINKYELNNNLQKIKEEKLMNEKENNMINKNEFLNEKKDIKEENLLFGIFQKILKNIKNIQSLINLKIDDKLEQLINKNEFNKLEIYNIANVICGQLEKIEDNIRNNNIQEKNNILKNDININILENKKYNENQNKDFRNRNKQMEIGNNILEKNYKNQDIKILEKKDYNEKKEYKMEGNMGWGVYISNYLINKQDNYHIYNNILTEAAIIGHNGISWANTKFFIITKDEVDQLTILFKQTGANNIPSVQLAGKKYQVIHYNPGFSTYLKIFEGGATVAKTNHSYIIGVYNERHCYVKDKKNLRQCSGMCNVVVEELAIKLKKLGY